MKHDHDDDFRAEVNELNARLWRLHLAREALKLNASTDRVQRRIDNLLFDGAAGECWNRLDELGVLPDPGDHEPGHA